MQLCRRCSKLWAFALRDTGATAVEFALVFPVVIALVFGTVEAGWVLDQRIDVREDAQVLAREASINFAEAWIGDMDSVLAIVCERLDLPDDAAITVDLPDGTGVGGRIEATVSRDLQQITGFFGAALGGKTVTSTSWAELQQDAAFSAVSQQCDGDPVVPNTAPTPTPAPTSTPVPTPTPATATPTPIPTPEPLPECTVPDFDNVRKKRAVSLWTAAGFTGAVGFLPGSRNYKISYQSIDEDEEVTCSSSITVGP